LDEPHDSAARWARADELYREAQTIRQRDPDRLKALAEQSLELALEPGADGPGYRLGQANALSLLAYHSATQGDVETALRRAAQAMSSLDSMEPSTVLGDIYDAMGRARFAQGNIAEAAEVLNRALGVARTISDRSLQARALDGLSRVRGLMGRWQEALDGHLEALGIQLALGDSLGAALIRSHMSRDYVGLGQTDVALESALEALEFADANSSPYLEMAVTDALAAVYLEVGELEPARACAVRSLGIARDQSSWLGESDSLMTLGRVEFAQGHLDKALEAVNCSLGLAEQHGRAVLEYQCHELLADIYEQQGDAATALAEHRRFYQLAESRINAESAMRLAYLGMEHQLETARKDAEIHRLRSLALAREVEKHRVAQVHLEAEASIDPLTGLYNRRQLSVFADEIQEALGRHEPVCLMAFDIDRFKEVNDTHGHMAGDRVLVAVANQLIKNSRASDMPCRYGGDEFIVLLVGMDAATGAEAAERLRSAIEATPVETDEGSISVTISVGVSSVPGAATVDLPRLIERADRALYAAKHSGRNRAVVA
jgi:diguanylate cyclase (GGDEF)-like protein